MSDTPVRSPHSTRDLPTRANLEHLKNEAKERLKTEAQLLVARSYGFPSWPKLKSYVDALQGFGQQLINAVRDGNLETIREILDGHSVCAAEVDKHRPQTRFRAAGV